MHFCSQLYTLDTFLEVKRVHISDFDHLLKQSTSDFQFVFSNTSTTFKTFHREFINFKRKNIETTKRDDSKFLFGMQIRLMLDEKRSKEEMTDIAKAIVEDKYKNYPFFCWYFKRGNANYLIIFICDRLYFNGKTKTFRDTYKKDIYEDSITHRFCSKDNKNAVLKFEKGNVRTTHKAKFSKKNDRLFWQFGKINKDQFKKWSYHMRVYLFELLKKFGAKEEFGVTLTQIPHESCFENNRIPRYKRNEYLVKCKYINKRIKGCASYFSRVISNLENGGMLEDNLVLELKKLHIKCLQRIKIGRFVYKPENSKHTFKYKIDFRESWTRIIDSMDTFEELVKRDIDNFVNKEILGNSFGF